jgi:hypothetical protein
MENEDDFYTDVLQIRGYARESQENRIGQQKHQTEITAFLIK